MTKTGKKQVRKFTPEAPEARDEGPRLIPLRDSPGAGDWGSHLLELADRALGNGHPPRKNQKKRRS